MGFPLLVRQHVYIESGPRLCPVNVVYLMCSRMVKQDSKMSCWVDWYTVLIWWLWDSQGMSHGRQLAAQIARFMGPTWGSHGVDRTQVGPVLAPWTLLSGWCHHVWLASLDIIIKLCCDMIRSTRSPEGSQRPRGWPQVSPRRWLPKGDPVDCMTWLHSFVFILSCQK